MPRLFRFYGYLVYFWTHEGKPTEPIHIHISEGVQSEHADKFWLTKDGRFIADKNNKFIPYRKVKHVLEELTMTERIEFIKNEWLKAFNEITYKE